MDATVSYYWICLAVLAAAAVGTAFSEKLRRFAPATPESWMWVLTALAAAIFAGLGYFKVNAMQMGMWDFGIYDSMMHYAATGQGLMRDYRGAAYDHFSPVMLLLTPVYWVWNSPMVLIWAQSLALAAGVPLAYFLARRYFPQGSFPLLLAAMYLLNPYYARLALFDFHSECFFPALFLGAFLLRAQNRWRGFAALLIAAPLIKEDFVVPLAAVGLWLIFTPHRRRLGALFFGAAVGWTLFVLFVYFPHIVHMDYWHFDRYGVESASGIAGWFGAFGAMFRRLFAPTVPAVLLSILLPFAFLPLGSWKMLLWVVAPTLGIHLTATFGHQNLLMSHYSSALIGVLPVAALWGARTLRAAARTRPAWRRHGSRALCGALMLTLCCHLAFVENPCARYYTPVTGWRPALHGNVLALPVTSAARNGMVAMSAHAADFCDAVEKHIPPGATVTAQNEIGPYFIRRNRVFSIRQHSLTDYAVLDAGNYRGFEMPDELNRAFAKWKSSPDYRLIYAGKEGVVIFERKRAENLKKH